MPDINILGYSITDRQKKRMDDDPDAQEFYDHAFLMEVMKNPVYVVIGDRRFTYEKEQITKWWKEGSKTNPLTNESVDPLSQALEPNLDLLRRLNEYLFRITENKAVYYENLFKQKQQHTGLSRGTPPSTTKRTLNEDMKPPSPEEVRDNITLLLAGELAWVEKLHDTSYLDTLRSLLVNLSSKTDNDAKYLKALSNNIANLKLSLEARLQYVNDNRPRRLLELVSVLQVTVEKIYPQLSSARSATVDPMIVHGYRYLSTIFGERFLDLRTMAEDFVGGKCDLSTRQIQIKNHRPSALFFCFPLVLGQSPSYPTGLCVDSGADKSADELAIANFDWFDMKQICGASKGRYFTVRDDMSFDDECKARMKGNNMTLCNPETAGKRGAFSGVVIYKVNGPVERIALAWSYFLNGDDEKSQIKLASLVESCTCRQNQGDIAKKPILEGGDYTTERVTYKDYTVKKLLGGKCKVYAANVESALITPRKQENLGVGMDGNSPTIFLWSAQSISKTLNKSSNENAIHFRLVVMPDHSVREKQKNPHMLVQHYNTEPNLQASCVSQGYYDVTIDGETRKVTWLNDMGDPMYMKITAPTIFSVKETRNLYDVISRVGVDEKGQIAFKFQTNMGFVAQIDAAEENQKIVTQIGNCVEAYVCKFGKEHGTHAQDANGAKLSSQGFKENFVKNEISIAPVEEENFCSSQGGKGLFNFFTSE